MMSPGLQGEVAIYVHEEWLLKVWFFRTVESDFLVQVALHLTALVFSPGEFAPSGFLYIIRSGLASSGGRWYTPGLVWGDDVLLYERLPDTLLRAHTYLEVRVIRRDDIFKLAASFPYSRKILRRCAIKLSLGRKMRQMLTFVDAQRRLNPHFQADAYSLVDLLQSKSTFDGGVATARSLSPPRPALDVGSKHTKDVLPTCKEQPCQ
eukprot:339403-Prymnesium_polylepis.1